MSTLFKPQNLRSQAAKSQNLQLELFSLLRDGSGLKDIANRYLKGKPVLKVMVSILTYNGGDKTIKTIADVYAQKVTGVVVDVVIIDNNSSNDIAPRIRHNFAGIRIVKATENLGYSAGNNVAIDLALRSNADLLFVLNDDLQLMPDYIQEMVDFSARKCDAAAIGSTICLPGGRIQATHGTLKPWFAGVIWHNQAIDRQYLGARQVDAIQGAAIVLTKASLRMGFRFDDCLFFGGEEYDLACWARRNSLKVFLLEYVKVVHDTSQINLILNRWHPDPLNYYYAIRNSFYILHKYSESKLEYLIAIGYSSIRMLAKGMIFAIRGDFPCFKYIWKGIYDGMSRKMWKLNIHQ